MKLLFDVKLSMFNKLVTMLLVPELALVVLVAHMEVRLAQLVLVDKHKFRNQQCGRLDTLTMCDKNHSRRASTQLQSMPTSGNKDSQSQSGLKFNHMDNQLQSKLKS